MLLSFQQNKCTIIYSFRKKYFLLFIGITGLIFSGFLLYKENSLCNRQIQNPEYCIIDGHTHDLVPRNGSTPVQAGIEQCVENGIRGVILSFPLNNTSPAGLIKNIAAEMKYVKKYAAGKNINAVFVSNFNINSKISSVRQIEILPSVEYFDGVFDKDLKNIEKFKELGIKSITLIDNENCRLSEKEGGKEKLSPFGLKVIKRLNENGIKIDISHLTDQLQLEVIQYSSDPVFASHSNCYSIAKCDRNITDQALIEMTRKGGMILLTFDKEFLFGSNSANSADGITKIIEHASYIKKLCGIDHIGIGSDYGGSGRNAPNNLMKVNCFARIAEAFIKSGFNKSEIDLILTENIMNYFKAEL